jgi:hypothetical protein
MGVIVFLATLHIVWYSGEEDAQAKATKAYGILGLEMSSHEEASSQVSEEMSSRVDEETSSRVSEETSSRLSEEITTMLSWSGRRSCTMLMSMYHLDYDHLDGAPI